jgi:predicted AAA+ superfamily ATPase
MAESELRQRVLVGGYPEARTREKPDRRGAWFESYVTTILQRDVRDISNIEHLAEVPRLLALLASRACSLLNFADIARSLTLPQSTLKRYLALLEATFLVRLIPSWSANLGKRLIKSPKLVLTDTGLLSHLLGLDRERAALERNQFGHVLENFVAMEIVKQLTWSRGRFELFHFRTTSGQEVDLVLENAAGDLVGIEVKAAAKVERKDFAGLRLLAELAGTRFRRGMVLYTGENSVPFAANLHAMPISSLWR